MALNVGKSETRRAQLRRGRSSGLVVGESTNARKSVEFHVEKNQNQDAGAPPEGGGGGGGGGGSEGGSGEKRESGGGEGNAGKLAAVVEGEAKNGADTAAATAPVEGGAPGEGAGGDATAAAAAPVELPVIAKESLVSSLSRKSSRKSRKTVEEEPCERQPVRMGTEGVTFWWAGLREEGR